MNRVVVDTDVVSFLFKNHPNRKPLRSRTCRAHFAHLSHDCRRVGPWAIQRKWNQQRLHWLHLYLRRFTVVPSSPDLCRQWAGVMVAAQGAGSRVECADGWIAATAMLIYEGALVTHNRGDYLGMPGLTLISHAT